MVLLAKRYNRTRTSVYRVANEVRAQRVLLGRMSARLGGGFDAAEAPPQQVRRAPRPGDDGYRG